MPDKSSLALRPLADRVIVEPLEPDVKTAGGLLLPETVSDRPQEGMVVAAGPGRWDKDGKARLAMQVSPHDKVVFARYAGAEIRLGDKKYLILGEQEILAVVDSQPKAESH